MSNARQQYEQRVREKNKSDNLDATPTSDKAYDFKQGVQQMGAQTASAGAQKGDLLSTAGGGLMMSGNPYAMAAGLGLQVYAAGEANKRAAEEQQRKEYNDRIMRRQEMMNRIAQQGIQ